MANRYWFQSILIKIYLIMAEVNTPQVLLSLKFAAMLDPYLHTFSILEEKGFWVTLDIVLINQRLQLNTRQWWY